MSEGREMSDGLKELGAMIPDFIKFCEEHKVDYDVDVVWGMDREGGTGKRKLTSITLRREPIEGFGGRA